MKKTILALAFVSLLGFGPFASAEDYLRGTCSLKVEGNKSKFKALKESEVWIDDFELRPLTKFLIQEKLKRIIPNPESDNRLISLKKNRVVLFVNDEESLTEAKKDDRFEAHGEKEIKKEFAIDLEYIGRGMSAGSILGPAIRVSGASLMGVMGENVFKLENGQKEFQLKITVPMTYTKFTSVRKNGVKTYKNNGVATHISNVILKCNVHEPVEVVQSDTELKDVVPVSTKRVIYQAPELNGIKVIQDN